MAFTIRNTNQWANHSRLRNIEEKQRVMDRFSLCRYPFVDHPKYYGYTPTTRTHVRASEMFVVSYCYKESIDTNVELETEFINKLSEIGCSYHKAESIFRGKSAYRIIIYDRDVDIENVLTMLEDRTE